MSIEKFKPVVWATRFNDDLEKKLVFYEDCNHDYEGEAKEPGDSIKILGLGDPTIRSWSDGKLHVLEDPETIEDLSMTLPINQVCDFNFFIDDLDKRQAEGEGVLSKYMKKAKDKVAREQDAFIAGFAKDKNIKRMGGDVAITKDNILQFIDKAQTALFENDVDAYTQLTLTGSPKFTEVLRQAYRDLDTNNHELLKNGFIGKYGGIRVKMSNQVTKDATYEYIQLKTSDAIAFVKPYLFLDAYKPEKRFGDAVKGWALYDGKVVKPKEIITLKVKYS